MVVAGGAARGAWQAGVLRYLYDALPERLGYAPWPDVISGNSVGALNGVNIAARSLDGVRALSTQWHQMLTEDVYRVRPSNVATAIYNSFWSTGAFALLDAHPMYELVRRMYPEQALREAIAFGDTRAFIVAATDLDNGNTTLFLDSYDPTLWLQKVPGAHVVRGPITAEHCLASSALPLIFEPVRVGERLYVDGMLRQNTPMRPVIQTGASHVLVIGIDQPGTTTSIVGPVTPTFAFIAGKTLNALLMDPVDRDLRQLERLNEIIRWGRERYGPDFETELEAAHGLREVQVLRISPSQDLGALAREAFRNDPPEVSGPTWALLSLLADPGNSGESDLLSYLLFDHRYTARLEELGYADAKRNADVIARFVEQAYQQRADSAP